MAQSEQVEAEAEEALCIVKQLHMNCRWRQPRRGVYKTSLRCIIDLRSIIILLNHKVSCSCSRSSQLRLLQFAVGFIKLSKLPNPHAARSKYADKMLVYAKCNAMVCVCVFIFVCLCVCMCVACFKLIVASAFGKCSTLLLSFRLLPLLLLILFLGLPMQVLA